MRSNVPVWFAVIAAFHRESRANSYELKVSPDSNRILEILCVDAARIGIIVIAGATCASERSQSC